MNLVAGAVRTINKTNCRPPELAVNATLRGTAYVIRPIHHQRAVFLLVRMVGKVFY